MADCVFCAIAAEKAPSQEHEPWWPMVVVDPIGPHAPGHKLVIPPSHLNDATSDLYESPKVFMAAVKVGKLTRRPFNIITSVGAGATQSVFHLHVHVIPRGDGDGLPARWPWVAQGEGCGCMSSPDRSAPGGDPFGCYCDCWDLGRDGCDHGLDERSLEDAARRYLAAPAPVADPSGD